MLRKLKRLSLIVDALQRNVYNYEELRILLRSKEGTSYHASTLQKDIYMLRNDFKAPIVSGKGGLTIFDEQYNFLESIKKYIV